jgi:sugar lactone lactonase YvrE
MSLPLRRPPFRTVLPLIAVAAACSPARPAGSAGHRRSPDSAVEASRIRVGVDFRAPESARYDPDQDVYFISNINGGMSSRDGNGFIMRVNAANPADATILAQSGRGGVTLDAPKGLALTGDTLWVTDIDVVRGFDRHSGAPLATVDLRPLHARFLNDIVAAPDGTLYLTDTGIEVGPDGILPVGGDRVFHIGAGHGVTVVAEGDSLRWPNGIAWDAAHERLIVAPFHDLVSYVLALDSNAMHRVPLAGSRGQLDGVEVLPGGRVLVTSWGDSAVYLVTDSGSRRIIGGLVSPADIGLDTRRNVLAIPLPNRDRVEYWKLSLR